MKVIFRIFLGLLALVALILIAAVFINKDYRVTREISINKPKNEVFSFVKQLNNQNQYNKWVMRDPDMKVQTAGIDGTVGFRTAWEGKKAGKGEQKITSIVEGEQVNTELHFVKPFESKGQTHMTTTSINDQSTRVTWVMEGQSKWPMNFMNLFMDRMLGSDMEESLEMLKAKLEKK